MSDWLAVLSASIAAFDETLAAIRFDSSYWEVPTSCGAWTIADVLDHVVSSNEWVARLFDDATPEVTLALADRWRLSADRLIQGFGQGLDRPLAHPLGPARAEHLVLFRCTEHVLHGWDIAKAAGLGFSVDESAVAELLRIVRPIALLLQATGDYASPILDRRESPLDELLSLTGRDVAAN